MTKKKNDKKLLAPPANTESAELLEAAKTPAPAPEDQVISYDTTGNDNDATVEQAIVADTKPTESEAELVAKEIDDGAPPPPTLVQKITDSTYAVRLQIGFLLACLAGKLQDGWTKLCLRVYELASTAWLYADNKLTAFGKWAKRRWDYIRPMSFGEFRDLAQMARDNPLEDTTNTRLHAIESLLKAQAKQLTKITKQASQVDPDMLAKYTRAMLDGRYVLATDLFRGMTGSTIEGATLQIKTLTTEPAPA